MELPVTISPLSQHSMTVDEQARPPSPLALDGWDVEDFNPDAWVCGDPNADELSEVDLLSLFQDAESMMEHTPQRPQQQDAGNDGDTSSVVSDVNMDSPAGWLERDLLSPSDIDEPKSSTARGADTCPAGQSTRQRTTNAPFSSRSSSGSSSSIEDRHAERNTSVTTWSTTSASEDSDDGSRSNLSVCTTHSSPASAPIPTQDIKQQQSPVLCPQAEDNTTTTAPPSPSSYAPSHESSSIDDSKCLSVSSGAGRPILPFTFAPGFVGVGANNSGPAGAVASAAMSALPNLGDLQAAALAAASGAAGQAIAAGWKRLRGGGQDGADAGAGDGVGQQQLRCLLSTTGKVAVEEGCSAGVHGHSRVNKRAKREERLMKNREAANRSRIKRKEVLGELENRAATLSSNLTASREENDTLKQEIASLREQNSFLRGMISVTTGSSSNIDTDNNSAADLPPVLPTTANTTTPRTSLQRHHAPANGSGSRRNRAAAGGGASAVAGAVGTALAVVSCVALSAAGFGGGDADCMGAGGSGRAGDYGSYGGSGGRRMLLSIDDDADGHGYDYRLDAQSAVGFGSGSGSGGGWFGFMLKSVAVQQWEWAGICLAVGLLCALVVVVARAVYEAATQQRSAGRGGGRGGGVKTELGGVSRGFGSLQKSYGRFRKLM